MRIIERFLAVIESHLFQMTLSILLIFTALEEFLIAFENDHWTLSLEHGLMFLYLNLFLTSLGKLMRSTLTLRGNPS